MSKITADDIDLSKPVELIALSVKERTARCRLLGSDRTVTLRAGGIWEWCLARLSRLNHRNSGVMLGIRIFPERFNRPGSMRRLSV